MVYQVVINTLSEDNNTINNEYIRMDKDGKITGVTHVTYHPPQEVAPRQRVALRDTAAGFTGGRSVFWGPARAIACRGS